MATTSVETAADGSAFVKVEGEHHTLRMFVIEGTGQEEFNARLAQLETAADTPAEADPVMADDDELSTLLAGS